MPTVSCIEKEIQRRLVAFLNGVEDAGDFVPIKDVAPVKKKSYILRELILINNMLT